MSRQTLLVAVAACAGVVPCASLTAFAGDLNPPVGPVAPTLKTLVEVEPRIAINSTNTPGDADSLYRISASGSYYLTGDVFGVLGLHGIEIGASNVTIDLMGFVLVGVPGSLAGIRTDAARNNVTIRNGIVTSWGGDGVNLVDTGASGDGSLIEGVHASSNGGFGLRGSNSGVIRSCTAVSNLVTGIVGSDFSLVESCVARLNGLDGIGVEDGGEIRGCVARDNADDGISALPGAFVTECTSTGNDGDGFSLTAATNVTACAAYTNSGNGFTITLGSMISGCTASSNFGDGIWFNSDCQVLNNTCDSNGAGASDAAGIHATGSDNRIEGNKCSDGDRGIDIDGAGNIIIRNTCSGNTTNWAIVANNVVGPILDRTAPASAAISGNSAPDSTGSTHPNANFTY